MMGIAINGPAVMFVDNEAVVKNIAIEYFEEETQCYCISQMQKSSRIEYREGRENYFFRKQSLMEKYRYPFGKYCT